MKKTKKILLAVMCFALVIGVIGAISIFAAEETVEPGSKGEIDVWLIGGQSNAVGYAKDTPDDMQADSRYTEGFDNVLYYGYHEGNTMNEFVPVTSLVIPKSTPTSGAELGIASALANSGRMNAVIKCATGSTKLYPEAYRTGAKDARKTWTSPSYIEEKGITDDDYIGNLYTDFIETVTRGINLLIEDGYTPVIKGMLWAQGEGETNDVTVDGTLKVTAETMSTAYGELLTYLVNDVRRDVANIMGDASLNGENPMPFGMVKITKNPTSSSYQESIPYVANVNAAQESLVANAKNAFVIDPTEAFGFGQHDGWHFNSNTQKYIGEQFVVGATSGKYLVTSDGRVMMNSAMFSEGDSVTVTFTPEANTAIYSVTKIVGEETELITLGDGSSYTFTMPASEVRFNVVVDADVTEYGIVPAHCRDTAFYPWIIFDKDKNFVGSAANFMTAASGLAIEAGDGAVIVLRGSVNFDDVGEKKPDDTLLSRINGSVTVDLLGNTVTMGNGGGTDAFIRLEPTNAGYSTTVTLKNGKIIGGQDPITRFSALSDNAPAEYYDKETATYNNAATDKIHKLTAVIEDLDIVYNDGVRATYAMSISGASPSKTFSSDNNIYINNCSVDFGNSYALDKSNNETTGYYVACSKYFPTNVVVTGGSIKADSAALNMLKFINMSGGAAVFNPDSNQKYTQLILSNVEKNIPTENVNIFDGEATVAAKYLFSAYDGENNVYELSTETTKEATIYGNIPSNRTNANSYPFVVFNSDTGDWVGGWSSFKGVLGGVRDKSYTDNSYNAETKKFTIEKNYTILMRRKYQLTADEVYTNIAHTMGIVTIDLNGFALDENAGGTYDIFHICAKNIAGKDTAHPVTFIVKNGYMNVYDGSVMNCYAWECVAGVTLEKKYMNWTYENVTFGLLPGATTTELLFTTSKNITVESDCTNEHPAPFNTTFNNCVFDLSTNAPEGQTVKLFNPDGSGLAKAWVKNTVAINGGKIIVSDISKVDLVSVETKRGSSVSFGKYNGKYIDLFIPNGQTYEAEIFKNDNAKEVKFIKYDADETYDVYQIAIKSLCTKYGAVSEEYSSKTNYPWIVFNKNGLCVGAGKLFTTDVAKILAEKGGDGAVVYLRADYDMKSSKNSVGGTNLGQLNGSATIDLNGKTVTISTGGNADAFIKCEPYANGYVTNIKVINGTFIAGEDPIIRFGVVSTRTPAAYFENDDTNPQTFNVTLYGVTVNIDASNPDITKASTLVNSYSTASANVVANTFIEDCTVNITSTPEDGISLFRSASNHIAPNNTVKGGTINIASGAVVNWVAFATDKTGHKPTLRFDENSDGKHVVLSLAEGASLPGSNVKFLTADGVECVFVKASETDENANYTLYPEVMVGYKIKTSVTLYSNFVYNVYIPKANVASFNVNGKTKADEEFEIDGVLYYLIKVELPAPESLSDIAVCVTLNSGDATVDANWTLSVLKYAKSVIGGGYDDTTKNLMRDMLVYASAAHTYFENTENVADKLTEIDTLLGDYNAELPEGEAKAPADNTYFTSATVNLGEVPSFRFYLAEGYTADDFSFQVGQRNVTATTGEDKYGNYLEVVMYAYMMLDDVTYTVTDKLTKESVTESYNLYSYYRSADEANVNLIALVEGLMKYSVSAAAYRDSVIGAEN